MQLTENLSPYVWTPSGGAVTTQATTVPAVGQGLAHGTFYYNQTSNIVWILQRGGANGGQRCANNNNVNNNDKK